MTYLAADQSPVNVTTDPTSIAQLAVPLMAVPLAVPIWCKSAVSKSKLTEPASVTVPFLILPWMPDCEYGCPFAMQSMVPCE